MPCPAPEALAQLAGEGGDPETRAAIADHAASCESCHAAIVALVTAPETTPPLDPPLLDPGLARVDRYLIKRRLGAGGMGVVYEATDPELGRNIAIKMLRGGGSAERLRREAQALARLDHPNVVRVHDVGEHDGQMFVAMALVDGENLRQWLARGPHPMRDILRVLVSAGRGVAAAHVADLIHRDLKPDNIFVSRAGDVLVGDFGLARDASEDDPQAPDQAATAAMSLTMTGTLLGTPAYMAPEQAEGDATERSDQFSFCVTAYEALVGARPFAGANFEELQANVRAGRFAELARPDKLPARVLRALRRGLAADPARRYPTMAALLDALAPPRGRARYVVPIAGLAIVASALAVTLLVTRGDRSPDCTATRGELATVWDAWRRDAVARTLRARGATPEAASELTTELDHVRDRWLAVREETCVAEAEHRVSADQAATRNACLQARAAELGQVVRSLESDRTTDALAQWQRITGLWPAEACRDDATARLSVGASAHQDLMQEIATYDHPVIDVHALEALRARADAAHDVPALLEVDLKLGKLLIDTAAAKGAEVPLQRALAVAEKLGVPSARIQALALLARSSCKQGRYDESAPLLVMADADSARDVSSAVDADIVLRARAECLYQQRAPHAEPMLRELVAHSIARYGADSPRELDLHLELSSIYYSAGKLDDGARELAAFNRILARFVAPGTDVAQREEQAAASAMEHGDLDLATQHERRAVELWDVSHVNDRASSLASLALMYELAAAWQLSALTDAEVVALVAHDDATSKELRVEALVQSGVMKLNLGELEQAATLFHQGGTEAREIGRADLALDADIGQGRVSVERGDFARGARMLRDALPAYVAQPNASAFRTGAIQFALARALWETGDHPGGATMAKLAEDNTAKALDEARSNPLGGKLVAFRTAQLALITKWRDQRR